MRFKPHDYQRYAIHYIETHPIAAILLDMGLGKTVNTLTAARPDLWEMPLYDGARRVDLGDPNMQVQPGPTAWQAAGHEMAKAAIGAQCHKIQFPVKSTDSFVQ